MRRGPARDDPQGARGACDLDLSRFPGVRLAERPADNDRLLRFYESSGLEGGDFRIRARRRPDFFALLDLYSDDHRVWIHESEVGEISGSASLSYRPGWIDGGPVSRVGYLGDFRVNLDRRVVRLWREFYAELLREERDTEFLTAVIDGNARANRALISSSRRTEFVYERIAAYRMVNVIARPLAWLRAEAEARAGLAHPVSERELPEVAEFLDRQQRGIPFGYRWREHELPRRLARWPGLAVERFLIVRGGPRAAKAGPILGVVAAWSPGSAKANLVERVPTVYRLLSPLLQVPGVGAPLETLYLTHLEIDRDQPAAERARIFRALFDGVWSRFREPKHHCVSFCDFDSDPFSRALEPLALRQEIPMGLYEVRHRERQRPQWLELSPGRAGFEIALV